MNKLLEKAIAEASALPADQQEAVAARILDEVRRQSGRRTKWGDIADRLARLDALRGKREAFLQHSREFRDSFRLQGAPDP